jgi:hypothetical protein
VSSSAVPPSAQYALTAALAVPRLAASAAAITAEPSELIAHNPRLHEKHRRCRTRRSKSSAAGQARSCRVSPAARTIAWAEVVQRSAKNARHRSAATCARRRPAARRFRHLGRVVPEALIGHGSVHHPVANGDAPALEGSRGCR